MKAQHPDGRMMNNGDGHRGVPQNCGAKQTTDDRRTQDSSYQMIRTMQRYRKGAIPKTRARALQDLKEFVFRLRDLFVFPFLLANLLIYLEKTRKTGTEIK